MWRRPLLPHVGSGRAGRRCIGGGASTGPALRVCLIQLLKFISSDRMKTILRSRRNVDLHVVNRELDVAIRQSRRFGRVSFRMCRSQSAVGRDFIASVFSLATVNLFILRITWVAKWDDVAVLCADSKIALHL